MPPRAPTADDISDWLTPSLAVQLLTSLFGEHTSINTLIERLRGGMVRAVARHSVWEDRTNPVTLTVIPPDHWEYIRTASASFWRTGDVTYSYRDDGNYNLRTVRHFDVRFEPQGVHAIIASSANITASAEADEAADAPKGPPVSEAHLNAWFDLYQQAYQGPADTLATALESARGMFPDRFVSRERVRKLCEGRKRGRKGGAAN